MPLDTAKQTLTTTSPTPSTVTSIDLWAVPLTLREIWFLQTSTTDSGQSWNGSAALIVFAASAAVVMCCGFDLEWVKICWLLTYPQSLSESRETCISANATLKDLGGRRVVGQQIALFRASSRFSKCGSMRRRWVRLAAIGLLASLMQLLFGLLVGGLKMFELVEQPG